MGNVVSYAWGYYLVDEIYPEWVTLVKLIAELAIDDHKRIRYKRMHKAAKKDRERAFGVLKKKMIYITNHARQTRLEKIRNMICTYIILHNMIRNINGRGYLLEEAH